MEAVIFNPQCTGNRETTDYCHRNVSFAYTKDREDIYVDRKWIKMIGPNRLMMLCSYCHKPTVRVAKYLQYCGECLRYYSGSPESMCCNECEADY